MSPRLLGEITRPLVPFQNLKCAVLGFNALRGRRYENSEFRLPHTYLRIGKRTSVLNGRRGHSGGYDTDRLAATELIIILANRYACLRNGRRCPLSRKSAGASDFLLLYLTRTLQFFFFSCHIWH